MSQIVHNAGVNYTLYYNILNYFKTIMKNHPSIGVATYGDIAILDTVEYPAFPIANINILDTTFGTSTTNYSVQLIVADKIKNKNNESVGPQNLQTLSYFGQTDDMLDIHANTLGILNDLTAFTQRGVVGFDIDGDIDCKPFSEEFADGLAGWVATFTLTTHNDKNRCLFFLVNPSEEGYLIRECLSGDLYRAVLNTTGSIGEVFSTVKKPGQPQTYSNLVCYTIEESLSGNDWDFINLPILALPYEDYGTCQLCELWIQPKIWGTTPQTWNYGTDVATKTWIGN